MQGNKRQNRQFKTTQGKIRTDNVIYDAFVCILRSLLSGSNTPTMTFQFNSDIDRTVKNTWSEQEAIWWDHIFKGRISNKWDKAQAMYYNKSPHTRDSKIYSDKEWISKVVGSFIDFSLGLWKERCVSLHRATEASNKTIKKDIMIKQVWQKYAEIGTIRNDFQYLFQGSIENIIKWLSQYIHK